MKSKYPSYPKLPNYILKADDKNYTQPNEGLRQSCIRGFYDRVNNWYLQNPELS
jgi:hypothetical protein